MTKYSERGKGTSQVHSTIKHALVIRSGVHGLEVCDKAAAGDALGTGGDAEVGERAAHLVALAVAGAAAEDTGVSGRQARLGIGTAELLGGAR